MFEKVDTKEKAYMIGFISGDGYIPKKNQCVEITVAKKDSEIPKFFKSMFGDIVTYSEDNTFDKKRRIYPSATAKIYSKKEKESLIMLYGGRLTEERKLPRLKQDLDIYFLSGIFDAQGCITWGYRKDRNRLWQKVSFTAQRKVLEGVQKILINNGISTILKPKSDDKCFIIEFGNELDVYKFYKLLPTDIFSLERKRKHFEEWLDATILKYTLNDGDVVTPLDYRSREKYDISSPELKKGKKYVVDSINGIDMVSSLQLSKIGISNIPLRLELVEISESINKNVILREA